MKPSPLTVCVIGLWLTSSSIEINPLEDENYYYHPLLETSEDSEKLQTAADISTSSQQITLTKSYTTQLPEDDVPQRRIDNYPETTIKSTENPAGSTGKTGLNSVDMLKRTLPGTPGQDYPILSAIPRSNFQCKHKGLYADLDSKCQAFHICSPDGRKYSLLCPNGTIFNQRHLVCDWFYNVKCAESPDLYVQSNQKVYPNSEPRQKTQTGNTIDGSFSALVRKEGHQSIKPTPLHRSTTTSTTTAAPSPQKPSTNEEVTSEPIVIATRQTPPHRSTTASTTSTTTTVPSSQKPSTTRENEKVTWEPFVMFGENDANETRELKTTTFESFGTSTTPEIPGSSTAVAEHTNSTDHLKGHEISNESNDPISQNDMSSEEETTSPQPAQVSLYPPPQNQQPSIKTKEIFPLPGPHANENSQSAKLIYAEVAIPTAGGFVPSSGPPQKKPSAKSQDIYGTRSYRMNQYPSNGQFQIQNQAPETNKAIFTSNLGHKNYESSKNQGWEGIRSKYYVTY